MLLLPFSVFVYDPVLRAFAEHRYFLVILRCITVALMTPGLFFLSGLFGLIGVMAAVVIFNILERGILLLWVSRILGSRFSEMAALIRGGLPIAACSVVAALFAFGARQLLTGHRTLVILAGTGIVFLLIDLTAVLLARVLNAEEMTVIRRYTARILGPIANPGCF